MERNNNNNKVPTTVRGSSEEENETDGTRYVWNCILLYFIELCFFPFFLSLSLSLALCKVDVGLGWKLSSLVLLGCGLQVTRAGVSFGGETAERFGVLCLCVEWALDYILLICFGGYHIELR